MREVSGASCDQIVQAILRTIEHWAYRNAFSPQPRTNPKIEAPRALADW